MRGDRLREARIRLGWSQQELGNRCRLAQNQIHRYEAEKVEPYASHLKLLAETLGVTTDYLLGLSGNPEATERELTDDERDILDKFRREGWVGLVYLSVDRVVKKS